jgi:biopolymer transport protein ExbD
MAFNTGDKKGSISEINVTPFVDVMLVLLVIFMVTAPMMLNGIQLELPKTEEVNRVNLQAEQVILSFTRAQEFFIGQEKVLKNELIPEIGKRFKNGNTQVLFLRADYGLNYGEVAKLMSFLKRGGVTQIAMITELEN